MATDLDAYRKSDDYREFLTGILEHSGVKVAKAQAALNDAERSRRVDAVIAVRAGFGKAATANKLGISRPTLDAWIKAVEDEPAEMESVLDHERFVARRLAREEATQRKIARVRAELDDADQKLKPPVSPV